MGLPQNPIRELFLVDGQAGTPTALGDLAFGTFGEDGLGIANTIIIDWAYIAVLAAFVIAFYVLLERLGRSPFGRMLKAIREDELVADSLGKNVDLIKIKVFVIGCALMGLPGSSGSAVRVTSRRRRSSCPCSPSTSSSPSSSAGPARTPAPSSGGIVFATVLFEGPRRVGSSLRDVIDAETPSSFADAIVTLDPTAFLAYATDNIAPLQFVFLGLILVFIMHRRPDGILGDRIETAAAVDLSEAPAG